MSISALSLDTTVRQLAKSDFCRSDLGVAFGHSAILWMTRLNLRSPGRIPLVIDEDGLGAEGFDWDSTATAGLSF